MQWQKAPITIPSEGWHGREVWCGEPEKHPAIKHHRLVTRVQAQPFWCDVVGASDEFAKAKRQDSRKMTFAEETDSRSVPILHAARPSGTQDVPQHQLAAQARVQSQNPINPGCTKPLPGAHYHTLSQLPTLSLHAVMPLSGTITHPPQTPYHLLAAGASSGLCPKSTAIQTSANY